MRVIREFTKGTAKCFASQPYIANLSIYVKLYAKKKGQNRLVFATKNQNNDFIFLSGEVDSMKKKISNPFIIIHIYIRKKVHRYGDIFRIKHAKK